VCTCINEEFYHRAVSVCERELTTVIIIIPNGHSIKALINALSGGLMLNI
jgi:hypothetical protein